MSDGSDGIEAVDTIQKAKNKAMANDILEGKIKLNDEFLLRKPFISVVCIYPDGTAQDEIHNFIAAIPLHDDIEIVMVGNVQSNEEKCYLDWREGRITNAFHEVTEFEFDRCRNVAKSIARGEWIISLDLDEKLLTTGAKLVDSLKLVPPNVDSLRVTNVSLKTTTKDGIPESFAGLAIRIFRNLNYINFEGRCHEVVNHTVARTAQSHFIIQHSGYLCSGEALMRKLERNLLLLCKEVIDPRNNQTRQTALKYICMTGRDLAPAFT